MRKPILVSTALLLLILAGLIYFQSVALKRLKLENDPLRTEARNLTVTSSEIPEPQANPATNQADLFRLRGEVARLHASLAEAKALIEALTNSPVESSDAPVENYLINVQTNLNWGETLVVGGWKMAGDARGIIMIKTVNDQSTSSYNLRAQLFLVDEKTLSQLELDSLKVDSKRSSSQVVLSTEGADRVSEMLRLAGLKPQAVTSSRFGPGYDPITYERRENWGGKQFSLFMHPKLDPVAMGNGLFSDPLMPVLIVTPTVSPDRQSLQLTVSALLNYPLGFPIK